MLASGLQPTDAEMQQVQASVAYLIENLNSKAEDGLVPASHGYHYIGSYARQTKPAPADDIDILYIVGEAEKHAGNWHMITKNTFPYMAADYDDNNNLSSLFLLNRIKKAISSTYPNSDLRRNHEVVNVYLASYARSFDLVPAWYIRNADYYLIPQGEQKHRWKKTNPFRDSAIVNTLDKKTSSTTRAAIMIVKHWFTKKRLVTPRSYHLEAIAYRIFTDMEGPSTTLADSVAVLLNNFGYENLLQSCPDPTGLSEHLTSGLQADDIAKICAEGTKAATILWCQGEETFLEEIGE